MEAVVLNANLESVGDIDIFKSFLWVDKYDKYGEFELVNFPSTNFLNILLTGKYVLIQESEHIGVIETINIQNDLENGTTIVVKGKSLESILNRRIIWDDTNITGSLQTGIEQLLDDSAISPTDTNRTITELEFVASSDPAITGLTMEYKFIGDNLYDVISSLCIANGIGFKIVLSPTGKFQFKLYSGVDRSYNQSTNPYVVFSPNFDNLINGNYLLSDEIYKNVALIGGEMGIENARFYASVESVATPSGLNRRELFVDASGISRNIEGGGQLTDAEYTDKLEAKGLEELANYPPIVNFDGDLEYLGMYAYDTDFFMGDIVQVADEYGHEASSRVTEIAFFQDEGGIKAVPTFTSI